MKTQPKLQIKLNQKQSDLVRVAYENYLATNPITIPSLNAFVGGLVERGVKC